jgi:hypothetical protein
MVSLNYYSIKKCCGIGSASIVGADLGLIMRALVWHATFKISQAKSLAQQAPKALTCRTPM